MGGAGPRGSFGFFLGSGWLCRFWEGEQHKDPTSCSEVLGAPTSPSLTPVGDIPSAGGAAADKRILPNLPLASGFYAFTLFSCGAFGKSLAEHFTGEKNPSPLRGCVMLLKLHSESFKCAFQVICSGIPHLVCSLLFFLFLFGWKKKGGRNASVSWGGLAGREVQSL